MKKLLFIIAITLSVAATTQEEEAWSIEKITEYLRENSTPCDVCTDVPLASFTRSLERYRLGVNENQSVSIRFTDLSTIPEESGIKNKNGFAAGYGDPDRVEIYLDLMVWMSLDTHERVHVLFHELSHDYLDSVHNDDPKHLMHANGDIPEGFDQVYKMLDVHFTEVYDAWMYNK